MSEHKSKEGFEHMVELKNVETGVMARGPNNRMLFIPGLKVGDPQVAAIIEWTWAAFGVVLPYPAGIDPASVRIGSGLDVDETG